MKRIVTLTLNPSIDVACQAEVVEPTHKTRCYAPRYDAGGGGINVSRAIAKLGGHSTALFAKGGLTGAWLDKLLEAQGIERFGLPIEGIIRESFTVTENNTGLQYRFNMPGPQLAEGEWQRCIDAVCQVEPKPDYLVLSGSLPPGVPDDFYGQIAANFRHSQTRVVVDTSGRSLQKALEAGVYLCKPNRRELGQVVDEELKSRETLLEAARFQVENHQAEVVAVSLADEGMLWVSKTNYEFIPAPKVKVVSAVGAGDSSVAGMVLGLAQDWSLAKAIRYGIAAGTAAVLTPGTELCRKEDTDRIFAELASPVH